MKIQPIHIGIVTSITRVWDAVNDPIVGAFVDRASAKNGSKLHRYLGKLALVIGVLSLLLFFNPGFGETGLIIYVLIVYLLWDMTYSFQNVAIWGYFVLISPHSSERTKGS